MQYLPITKNKRTDFTSSQVLACVIFGTLHTFPHGHFVLTMFLGLVFNLQTRHFCVENPSHPLVFHFHNPFFNISHCQWHLPLAKSWIGLPMSETEQHD